MMLGRVLEFQTFVGRLLYSEDASIFTDVEEWKGMQSYLTRELRELEQQEGSTPEEEGELVLAILMGYSIAIWNSWNISRVLERAERVLPQLSDPVLKCYLAVFCYGECQDEELGEMAHSLLTELKQQGRGEEVIQAEKMFLSYEL